MASGHVVPHQQAGHMAAPTSLAPPSKKTLANEEPSTHEDRRIKRSPARKASGLKGDGRGWVSGDWPSKLLIAPRRRRLKDKLPCELRGNRYSFREKPCLTQPQGS
jgi:hypothetical protein